jgi:hypothetical protein
MIPNPISRLIFENALAKMVRATKALWYGRHPWSCK